MDTGKFVWKSPLLQHPPLFTEARPYHLAASAWVDAEQPHTEQLHVALAVDAVKFTPDAVDNESLPTAQAAEAVAFQVAQAVVAVELLAAEAAAALHLPAVLFQATLSVE